MKKIMKIPLFWILFGWNIMVVYAILWCAFRITSWMFGYWKCCICKEWYWINSKNHNSGGVIGEAQCEDCKDKPLPSDKPTVQKPSARIYHPPKGGSSIKKPVQRIEIGDGRK